MWLILRGQIFANPEEKKTMLCVSFNENLEKNSQKLLSCQSSCFVEFQSHKKIISVIYGYERDNFTPIKKFAWVMS